MNEVKFEDHSDEVMRKLESQIGTALEAVGIKIEGYAKSNLTKFPRVDTGRLRGSVSHSVDESNKEVVVGTNVEYGPYVEYGTGPFAEGHPESGQTITGRQDVPWFYKDEKGVGHLSYGMKPSHFLKNAVADHKDEIGRAIDKNLTF